MVQETDLEERFEKSFRVTGHGNTIPVGKVRNKLVMDCKRIGVQIVKRSEENSEATGKIDIGIVNGNTDCVV